MNDRDTFDAANKWNNKYLTDDRFQDVPVRKLIRENAHLLPEYGLALEIAGGMGATTDFLQRAGLNVIEVDISYTALRKAVQVNSAPAYILADARKLPLKPMQFDVICNFYFLERYVHLYKENILQILRQLFDMYSYCCEKL